MTANLLLPDLIALPGGTFVMGRDDRQPDERPAHPVTVAPFRAGVRPVSNAEYAAFVGATGHVAPRFAAVPPFDLPDRPVVGVSWYDAVTFCDWLSRRTGTRFRLPTEAEREYAALGGLERGDWPWGDDAPESDAARAVFAGLNEPHAPAEICRNGYGLYCMADNVHEWCSDWYVGSYDGLADDVRIGLAKRMRRASRGGSWRHQVKFNRVSARSSLNPNYRYNDYGFRVYADA